MIWCVEDDASIRDIEVYALTSTGFEARGFADGDTFWDALQRETPPELVVLDVMLPGTDGIELLRRLRASARFAELPVVMATAKGAEYDKIPGARPRRGLLPHEALRRDGVRLLRQGRAAPQPSENGAGTSGAAARSRSIPPSTSSRRTARAWS